MYRVSIQHIESIVNPVTHDYLDDAMAALKRGRNSYSTAKRDRIKDEKRTC